MTDFTYKNYFYLQKRQTPRKDEWNSSVDQENLETPAAMRRPIAASTAIKSLSKYRPYEFLFL